jgi:hypothetical protein
MTEYYATKLASLDIPYLLTGLAARVYLAFWV